MTRLFLLLCGAAACIAPQISHALELNRCQLRIVVAGEGINPVELPRSRFTAWSRADTARNARVGLANHTRYCALTMVFGNYRRVPKYCHEKPAALKDPTKIAAAMVGFKFTLGREALKEAVCAKAGLAAAANAPNKDAAMDRRRIKAARVYINQVGGPGKCPDNTIVQMKSLTLYCRTPRDAAGLKDRRTSDGWVLYRVVRKSER